MKVLILGGAGFIGSAISKRFVNGGFEVIVLDGFLKKTGGSRKNLAPILGKIKLIEKRIEETRDLTNIIKSCDLIIDSMGWTLHSKALNSPHYDLELNLVSHLVLIENLCGAIGKKVIFLGTKNEYGHISGMVSEDNPMIPVDVQGINKLAAESYFRIYSNIYKFDVVSIRFGNTFGVNMRYRGDDIGLVGSLMRDLILGKRVNIYGKEHKRTFVYAFDIAEVVWRLANRDFSGFEAFNLNGQTMTVLEFVSRIIKILGRGNYDIEAMSEDVARMNVGDGVLFEKKLVKFIGDIPRTNFDVALGETVEYFTRKLRYEKIA